MKLLQKPFSYQNIKTKLKNLFYSEDTALQSYICYIFTTFFFKFWHFVMNHCVLCMFLLLTYIFTPYQI